MGVACKESRSRLYDLFGCVCVCQNEMWNATKYLYVRWSAPRGVESTSVITMVNQGLNKSLQ